MAALQKLLVIFLIHGASSLCSNSPKRFVTHPVNVDVKEGQNATFTCVVSNFNEDTDRITWYANPSLYDRKITSIFDEETREMVSTLTVLHVGRKQQSHHCELYALDDEFTVHMCHSNTGTLHVQYFPDKEELECGPKDQLVFDELDFIRVWCELSSFNPAMVVKWKLDNATLALSTSLSEDKDKDLKKSFEISYDFHNKNLSCIISFPSVFPGQELSCSIGPFIVNEKPIASIWMSSVTHISAESFYRIEEEVIDRGHLENITINDPENIRRNYVTSSEEVHTRHLNDLNKTPTRRSFATNAASLTLDDFTNITRHEPTAAYVFEINLPKELTKNYFFQITIGVVTAAALLITCLFTVAIIILYMHFKQPQHAQRSITINELQELHKFTSIIQNETLQSHELSGQTEHTPTEPAYEMPQLLTTLPEATAMTKVGQGDQTNLETYDSNIFDSRRPYSSSSSVTVSSTGSPRSSDSDFS